MFDYQSERHRSKTRGPAASRRLPFDYQSERHRSKTIGAKSPLQETALLTSTYHSAFDKIQVNNPFSLTSTNRIIRPSLKKKHWDIRKKDVLKERSQSPFR